MNTQRLNRIDASPEVLQGKPVIRNTRISVEQILDMLADGISPEGICSQLPVLRHEDITEAVRYARKHLPKAGKRDT